MGDTLNTFDNMKCNVVEGAMYAFPTIRFSDQYINFCEKIKMAADEYYCL